MLSFNIMIPFSSMSAFLVSLKNILQVKGMTKPAKKDLETVENIGHLGGDLKSMMDDPAVDNVFKALAEVDPEVKETLDCDRCGKTYGTKGSLRTHKYNHIKKEMIEEAKDIKEVVDNEVTIQENVKKIEDGGETFPCDQCGRIYGTKGSLRTHKYNHIKKELKPEDTQIKKDQHGEIDDVDKIKTGMKHLTNDESQQQTFEEKYKASLQTNEVEMANIKSLNEVEMTDIKSIVTEQIAEESPIDLKVLETCLDEITEQGSDGSWLCKKCGKKDKSKFHLRRHAEIHLEGFKHPCNFCEREFSQRALVKAHMLRNHSDERAPKPFNCDICNMPSTSLSAVKVHKQRQHPII